MAVNTVDLRVPVTAGVRLRVRGWPGQRRAFLLVHGLASNARLWDEVAARLAEAGHPAYAVDLRSHGESDAPAQGYDGATAAADLAALADALDLGTPIVVGQSWGGNVAVRLAAERPDLVAALALVDGGWIDLPAKFASWQECVAALRPPDLDGLRADDLRETLRRAHPDWSPTAVEATLASLRVRPDGSVQRRLSVDRHLAIVRSMWDNPPQRRYGKVQAPVLLLPAVPTDPEQARHHRTAVAAAAAALPDATIREYVGADHDLHAQHPAELATDLLALAERVR